MPTAVRTRRQQDQKVAAKKQSTTATTTTQQKAKTIQQNANKVVFSLSHDQALMNLQQSNTIVKTMLDATFGCMTFLRGLLPEGNFDDVQIAAPDPSPGSRQDKDDTLASASQKSHDESYGESQPKGGRGLRIKKIKRGYSTEADKLLDWIDVGVVEAVEKQYLKACVFAVYLDPEDPSNLVEALTINFHYPELAESGVRIPQFDIEDSIHKLHIGGSKQLGDSTDSARGPDGFKLRTIGEVKRAIKKLVKSLIITCQSLGELPSRRWVTMRLEYLDETPAHYEPPFFVAADANQKLHFDTKDISQVPDKTAIGHIETGFHSLSLKLTSITEFIPKAVDIDEEEETYGGFGASADKSYNLGKRRRADEAALRTDAAKRMVMWNALDTVDDRADIDPAYQDAEGEPDSQVPMASILPTSPPAKPMGIRQADGTIIPYSSTKSNSPSGNDLSQNILRSSELDPTYVSGGRAAEAEDIEDGDWHMDTREEQKGGHERDIPLAQGPADPDLSPILNPATSGVFPEKTAKSQDSDTEMVDPSPKDDGNKTLATDESISSFHGTHEKVHEKPTDKMTSSVLSVANRPRRAQARQRETKQECNEQAGVQLCPCAARPQDETMVECEGCTTWYHMPCAGYLREEDLPEKYICIICRMESAGHFSADKISEARSYLPSLTLERRALKKMYKKMKFESIYNMQKEIGCDANDFRNLLTRFQELGFLRQEVKQIFRKVNKTTERNVTITTYHAQDDPATRKSFNEYFKQGGPVELKAFGITSAMLKKGYAIVSEGAKNVAEKSNTDPVEKENIAPNNGKNTKAQTAKAIALPKPSRPVRLPTASKPDAVTVTKELGQPRSEVARPTIPLPKSKPRHQAIDQPSEHQVNVGKGLFRTAASITVQTSTSQEAAKQVDETSAATDAASMGAGLPKASVPEEDVDMGV